MEEERLFPVRCPALVEDKKKGGLIKCNRLCVKVFPGSAGECVCPKCKMKFRFKIDSQARSILSVKARPVSEVG